MCSLRWRRSNGRGRLEPVAHPHKLRLSDLRRQRARAPTLRRGPAGLQRATPVTA